MARYLLPDHVHLCLTDGGAVFLDLKRDAYTGLAPDRTSDLRSLLAGRATSQPSELAMLHQLAKENLLTLEVSGARVFSPIMVETPRTALVNEVLESGPRIGPIHIFNFFRAVAVARTIQSRGLHCVVNRAMNRKDRAGSRDAFDVQKGTLLIRIFKHLRPLAFSSKDHCYFYSHALLEFLSAYEQHPLWIFGVKTKPFTAHCWLQSGNAVLTGRPEYTANFTPILVI